MDDMPIQEKSESLALHFFHVVRLSRTDPTMLLSLGQMVPWCRTSEAAARYSQGVYHDLGSSFLIQPAEKNGSSMVFCTQVAESWQMLRPHTWLKYQAA